MAKTKQTDNTLPAIFAGKGELAPSAQAALEMAGAAPAAEEAPDNTGTPTLNFYSSTGTKGLEAVRQLDVTMGNGQPFLEVAGDFFLLDSADYVLMRGVHYFEGAPSSDDYMNTLKRSRIESEVSGFPGVNKVTETLQVLLLVMPKEGSKLYELVGPVVPAKCWARQTRARGLIDLLNEQTRAMAPEWSEKSDKHEAAGKLPARFRVSAMLTPVTPAGKSYAVVRAVVTPTHSETAHRLAAWLSDEDSQAIFTECASRYAAGVDKLTVELDG